MSAAMPARVTVRTAHGADPATVLVVCEGESRLRWLGSAPDWRLVGMWPDATDRHRFAEHLAAGRPLLVLLDAAVTVVPLWRAELGMPESAFETVTADGDLLEVTVPFLEWLPKELRERGQQFWVHTTAAVKRTPVSLQPAVIVEEPAHPDSRVRFAWRSRRVRLAPDELLRVAGWAFGARVPA